MGVPTASSAARAATTTRSSSRRTTALSLAELQIVGGSKNDGVRQVVTYEYAPFESILGLPRSGSVAPPSGPRTSLSYQPSNPEAAAAAVKAAALTATY